MLICCLVVLAGIGIFVPGYMKAGENAQARKKLETTLSSVPGARSAARGLNDQVYARFTENGNLANQDLKVVLEKAAQTSARPLICSDPREEVFPDLRSGNPIIYYRNFSNNYLKVVEDYLVQMNAADRPSEHEEEKVRLDYQKNIVGEKNTRSIAPGGGGMMDMGMDMGMGMAMPGRTRVAEDSPAQKLVNELRRQRSESITVYANKDCFAAYNYWETQPNLEKPIMLMDMWFTQLAAWIQQDVVNAVKLMNGESQRVADSPLKRLIEVSFNGAEVDSGKGGASSRRADTGVVAPRRAGSMNSLPDYVIGAQGAEADVSMAAGIMTYPWTKRVGDDLIDVVHLEIAAIIESTAVNDFINALQTGRLRPDQDPVQQSQITVLQMTLDPIDPEAEKNAGYYYGPGSLVTLRMICEYTLFKSGYSDIMPADVKALFEPVQAGGPGMMKR